MLITLEELFSLIEEHFEWPALEPSPRQSLEILFIPKDEAAEVKDSIGYEARSGPTFYVHIGSGGEALSIEVT